MLTLVFAMVTASVASPTDSCGPSTLLPAYAHNDYYNQRPLLDALALGYRGAEADVIRVGQELVVGHSRNEAKTHRTLARLYLDPLLSRSQSCGFVLSDSTPFLLNIELKDRDPRAFELLVALLAHYQVLFTGTRPAATATLVGWWPDTVVAASTWPRFLQVHVALGPAGPKPRGRVGLISIDYGKVLRWPGRGPISVEAKEAIVSARRAADSCGVPIRVHHVPARREVYKWLLSEGVTLIGVGNLDRDRALLLEIGAQPPDTRLKPPARVDCGMSLSSARPSFAEAR
jgi:hypothetical protein